MSRSVYLDHSASTPTDPRVVEAMMPYFTEVYGNALSVHRQGRRAEQAIENARVTIAKILSCKPSEIVFTSGGSESDNLALRGAAIAAKETGRGDRLITTPIEHSAIGRTIDQLADHYGFTKVILPVDQTGQVSVADFERLCEPGTVLASVILANNEVGTLEPISELAHIAHERGAIFHTDAVQAGGSLPLDVQALGVDLLSLSAHKFYGPKGVGLLYVRDGINLVPSQSGGSHEDGRRAGTHATPLIVGMAKALELAYGELEMRTAHYQYLRDLLIKGVLSRIPEAQLTGHPTARLPGHASFVFPGLDANKLLIHLDMRGVAASSASACKTGNPEPSGVLLALGYDRETALGSLRLSVGKDTTEDDVSYALDKLVESVAALKKLAHSLS
jgi:cysteine desulfurase